MDGNRTLYWSGLYAAAWLVGALLAAALIGVGYRYLGIGVAWDNYQAGTSGVRAAAETAAPGAVVAFLGVAVWRVVSAWAKYRTLVPAIHDELAETYDSEKVKSEILSVLDERLADMQQDLQGVQRELRTANTDDEESEFEFD